MTSPPVIPLSRGEGDTPFLLWRKGVWGMEVILCFSSSRCTLLLGLFRHFAQEKMLVMHNVNPSCQRGKMD